MRAAPIPENEAARLETLRQYQILDTDAEEAFDDLTRLTAYVCTHSPSKQRFALLLSHRLCGFLELSPVLKRINTGAFSRVFPR